MLYCPYIVQEKTLLKGKRERYMTEKERGRRKCRKRPMICSEPLRTAGKSARTILRKRRIWRKRRSFPIRTLLDEGEYEEKRRRGGRRNPAKGKCGEGKMDSDRMCGGSAAQNEWPAGRYSTQGNAAQKMQYAGTMWNTETGGGRRMYIRDGLPENDRRIGRHVRPDESPRVRVRQQTGKKK